MAKSDVNSGTLIVPQTFKKALVKMDIWDSVHPQPNWNSNQIFKKERLDRTSTFRGGCWESEGDFFRVAGLLFSDQKRIKIWNI